MERGAASSVGISLILPRALSKSGLDLRNYGAFTAGLRRLLVALAENVAMLPDISVERAVVEQALSAAEEAKARQDAHKGDKQVATQDLKVALARARDAA